MEIWHGRSFTMKRIRFFCLSLAVMSFLLSLTEEGLAAEKKFPSKPIQVIIGFQPGETDNLLRPFVERMPEYLGQPMNLTYKPGAGGSLAAGFVAASKPDGYTLFGSSQSSIVVIPLTQKGLGYTTESFAPIVCLVETPALFVVKPDAPWKNLKEFVAEAKKSPGKLTYSSSGTFGTGHLLGEAFAKEAGIKLTHIPSQGSTPAMTALMGGHLDMASLGAVAMPQIKGGTLRPLAVFNPKRISALPDTPTIVELGYKITATLIYGLYAPKNTPKEIIDTIYGAAKKIVEKDRAVVSERLDMMGGQIGFAGQAEFASILKTQYELFSKVMQDMKK